MDRFSLQSVESALTKPEQPPLILAAETYGWQVGPPKWIQGGGALRAET